MINNGIIKRLALLLIAMLIIGNVPVEAKTKNNSKAVSVIVSTKKSLLRELKKEYAQTITFKTDKAVSFKIPALSESKNKKLVIDAQNASIENKSKYDTADKTASLTIKAVKHYKENASENTFKINGNGIELDVLAGKNVKKMTIIADNANITVKKKANIEELIFKKKGALANINASKSSEMKIFISKKTNISITGEKGADVNITVSAKKSTVQTYIPIYLIAKKNMNLTLNEGAEGSVIDKASKKVKIAITNKSQLEYFLKVMGEEKETSTQLSSTTQKPTSSITPVLTAEPTSNVSDAPVIEIYDGGLSNGGYFGDSTNEYSGGTWVPTISSDSEDYNHGIIVSNGENLDNTGNIIPESTNSDPTPAENDIYDENDIPEIASVNNIIKYQSKYSTNLSKNNYLVWGKSVEDYLYEDNGYIYRVETVEDGNIIIEKYDINYNFIEKKIVNYGEELIWGGFYKGLDNYFVIVGKTNYEENDDAMVVRIIKYDKEWSEKGYVDICGHNTVSPFECGITSCAETNELLIVHTSHKMYTTEDGLNHESNFLIAINKEKMMIEDIDDQISLCTSTVYVSHSFNQFILVDSDGDLVFLNQGDAFPRSLRMHKLFKNNTARNIGFSNANPFINYKKIESIDIQTFTNAISDENKDVNKTGASVGGFEETDKGYIVAYNYDEYGGQNLNEQIRNMYIFFTDKNDKGFEHDASFSLYSLGKKYCISYKGSSKSAFTPTIVSMGIEKGGVILWEEGTGLHTPDGTICFVKYNPDGTISDVYKTSGFLSDCKPIAISDNELLWYIPENGTGEEAGRAIFYYLNIADNELVSWYSDNTDNKHIEKILKYDIPIVLKEILFDGVGELEEYKLNYNADGSLGSKEFGHIGTDINCEPIVHENHKGIVYYNKNGKINRIETYNSKDKKTILLYEDGYIECRNEFSSYDIINGEIVPVKIISNSVCGKNRIIQSLVENTVYEDSIIKTREYLFDVWGYNTEYNCENEIGLKIWQKVVYDENHNILSVENKNEETGTHTIVNYYSDSTIQETIDYYDNDTYYIRTVYGTDHRISSAEKVIEGVKSWQTIYEYGDDNSVSLTTIELLPSGEIVETTKTENFRNDVIEEKRIKKGIDGTIDILSEVSYRYEYDDYGNIVGKETYNNGNLTLKERQTFNNENIRTELEYWRYDGEETLWVLANYDELGRCIKSRNIKTDSNGTEEHESGTYIEDGNTVHFESRTITFVDGTVNSDNHIHVYDQNNNEITYKWLKGENIVYMEIMEYDENSVLRRKEVIDEVFKYSVNGYTVYQIFIYDAEGVLEKEYKKTVYCNGQILEDTSEYTKGSLARDEHISRMGEYSKIDRNIYDECGFVVMKQENTYSLIDASDETTYELVSEVITYYDENIEIKKRVKIDSDGMIYVDNEDNNWESVDYHNVQITSVGTGELENIGFGTNLFNNSSCDGPDRGITLLSAILSNEAYDHNHIYMAYMNLGFERDKIMMFSYPDSSLNVNYGGFTDNSLAFSIASKNMGAYTLMIITLRGTLLGTGDFFKDISSLNSYGQNVNGFSDFMEDVKEGFSYYLDNNGDIKEAFNNHSLKVLVTGHSLGAGGANLFADWLMVNNYFEQSDVYAYCFATPRVLLYKNRDYRNIYNYLNEGDFVPALPSMVYNRYGLDIYIDAKLDFTLNPLDYHSMSTYIRALKNQSGSNGQGYSGGGGGGGGGDVR